jgi:Tfp pilus assembly protein PilF
LLFILLGAILAAPVFAESARNELAQVNSALQAGQADKALALLKSLPQPDADSAQAHNLRCRVLFTLEQWEGSAHECEQAVHLDPQNSDYHLWLGRALGEQADRASFLNAYNLAKRARAEFEQSVQLDPHNAAALADLGEFYSAAPSVVGGGTGKANSVASQLDKVDPARAHELRAAIAKENKDLATAEQELKQAIAVSHHPAFQWMRLASLYRKARRWDDMVQAVRSGLAAAEHDPHAAVALFNGASVLVKADREPALAEKMLNLYLSSPDATEEAPAFTAHVWLARLKAQQGDSAGARQERSAALALANEYKPAQELKN